MPGPRKLTASQSVDLTNLFEHPGAYVSYDPVEETIYLNVMPQVRWAHTAEIPGTSVAVHMDRDDRIIGIAFHWNPDLKQ